MTPALPTPTVEQVLVVEDQPDTAAWLARLMTERFVTARIDIRTDLASAMRWLADYCGDAPLCLVDIGLPDGSGLEFVAALMRRLPNARAIVTTLYDTDQSVLHAMAAGAAGYILKDEEQAVIGDRIAALERGEVAMSPAISRLIMEQYRATARFRTATTDASLTPRELEVLQLIGRGLRVAEAADVLTISRETIAGYLKTIYRKLDINSRAEAALEAMRRGLV